MRWLWLCSTALAGASLQEVGKLPEHCRPKFLSPEFGWCTGSGGPKLTHDGGRTWTPLETPMLPSGIRLHGDRLTFIQAGQAWLYAGNSLFWTSDGGSTWDERTLPEGLVDVYFSNRNVGVATVWKSQPSHEIDCVPAVYRTTDGGRTWAEQQYANRQRYRDLRGGLGWLEFADSLHGLSVEHDDMYFTGDGGTTWKKARYCSNVNTKALHHAPIGSPNYMGIAARLLDAEYGWWTMAGDLFRTTDGGATWCQLPPIRLEDREILVAELHFANRELGWVVPDMFGIGKLPIFETSDGGQSWKAVNLPNDPAVYGMSVISPLVIFVWDNTRLYRLIRN